MIATNTVAQGDSREVGLDAMVAGGFTITRAIQSRSWPAATANLEYAAVWGTRATPEPDAPRDVDGVAARRITTLLEPAGRADGHPRRLPENAGIAFQGCIILGMGFVLEEAEAMEWIATDPKNAEVLFPYLNGEDLNQRPDSSASRWVIDFGQREERGAAEYPIPYQRVLERVKGERAKQSIAYRKDKWWRFAAWAPAMRKATSELDEVLVIARVSKSVMPVRVRTSQVFSHMLGVFATDDYGVQAVLSSSLHQLWAITYGSTLETRVRYTPSDVFETFPLPNMGEDLRRAGRLLHNERARIMHERGIGLTDLYNMVNGAGTASQEVEKVRKLHALLDECVIEAYGWSDVTPDYGLHPYRQAVRWGPDSRSRIELLDRLLLENLRRYRFEQDGR